MITKPQSSAHVALFVVGIMLLPIVSAMAQIRVGVKMDSIKYLAGQNIGMKLTIVNNTDVPLVFNDVYRNATLQANITRDGDVSRIGKTVELPLEFVAMTGETITTNVAVDLLLGSCSAGSYQIKVGLKYAGRIYYSQVSDFDIVPGIELIKRHRFLKDYPDTVLTYSVRYLGREGNEVVFLKITDENRHKIYGTFFLGRIVRVAKPVLKFDAQGRVVLVHQCGLYAYARSVISVDKDGAKFIEQTHFDLSGKPLKPAGKATGKAGGKSEASGNKKKK